MRTDGRARARRGAGRALLAAGLLLVVADGWSAPAPRVRAAGSAIAQALPPPHPPAPPAAAVARLVQPRPAPVAVAVIDPSARRALAFVAADGDVVTPARIRRFLEREGSPLARHAEVIVSASVEHGLDPRTVVAIAGAESGFGAVSAGHNAWGWGVWGDRVRGWPDWPTAIRSFTSEFAASYGTGAITRGLASRYCPPNSAWWYGAVRAIASRI